LPSYPVAVAKEQLSRLIDEALRGEIVTITRHGKPVAELHSFGRRPAISRAQLVDDIAERADTRPFISGAADLIGQMRNEER
jgi:prevent-host-death family protein